MNKKLKELLPQIEERLMSDDIEKFKIGITEQEIEKRLADYKNERYEQIGAIAIGEIPDTLQQAEKYLIDYFRGNKKCMNIDDGGNGNVDNADKLYIVVEFSPAKTAEDVHRYNVPLFNFNPVKI